jgi:hypothetical protein
LRILEFKHPLFQRDHPELLSDIRRGAPGNSSGHSAHQTQDYELLRCQINELTAQVEFLSNTVEGLKEALQDPRGRRYNAGDEPPPAKMARCCPRWETPLDEDTLHMLLTLDHPNSPPPLHTTDIEKRGAPYSHTVFKSGIFSQNPAEAKTDQLTDRRSPPPLPVRAPSSSSQMVDSRSMDHRTSVPLDHASAYFANLLTDYYSSICSSDTESGTGSWSKSAHPHPLDATAGAGVNVLPTEERAAGAAAHRSRTQHGEKMIKATK